MLDEKGKKKTRIHVDRGTFGRATTMEALADYDHFSMWSVWQQVFSQELWWSFLLLVVMSGRSKGIEYRAIEEWCLIVAGVDPRYYRKIGQSSSTWKLEAGGLTSLRHPIWSNKEAFFAAAGTFSKWKRWTWILNIVNSNGGELLGHRWVVTGANFPGSVFNELRRQIRNTEWSLLC